ncbi:hypothetical protein ACO02O_03013 [Dirofilaria immitis]
MQTLSATRGFKFYTKKGISLCGLFVSAIISSEAINRMFFLFSALSLLFSLHVFEKDGCEQLDDVPVIDRAVLIICIRRGPFIYLFEIQQN